MHKVLKQRPFQFGGYAITSPSIIGIEFTRLPYDLGETRGVALYCRDNQPKLRVERC
jgi:hypothetical protein